MKDKSVNDMSQHVLVVEDYADLRAVVVSALSSEHYRCDEVANSDDAIAMLRSHHYGTVLLSTRMPIADDPVVQYLLAEDANHQTKVILMADPDQQTDDYAALTKPFGLEQLFARMKM